MFAAIGIVFPVFALILIGWAIGRRGVLPAGADDVLNGFVVKLALPVLLFQFVAEADWATLWQPGFVAAHMFGVAIVFAITFLAARGRSISDRSITALATSYSNTAFMGIPIAQALFGTTGLAAGVMSSLLTICATFAFAILLVEIDLHRSKGLRHAVIGVLRSVAGNPLVIGPVAGAAWALTGATLPDPLHRLATLLGAAASPVALVTIGLFLSRALNGQARAGIAPLVIAKLIAQPLAVFGFVWLIGLRAPWGPLAVLIAALPTGTGPFMLARLYGLEAAAAGKVVLVTTLISAATIPLLTIWLMG